MENSEADMEQIRRNILEKLRRRFAQIEQGDTERFDGVLALWIDLNRAILLREKSEDPKGDCEPWESSDKSVCDAWDKFTDPNNLLPLPVTGRCADGVGAKGPAILQRTKRHPIRRERLSPRRDEKLNRSGDSNASRQLRLGAGTAIAPFSIRSPFSSKAACSLGLSRSNSFPSLSM